ncbi:high-affinity nickel-transport protein-domain-containing protein [Mycena leptocephala]|nr:high-affinity nickel-transport protein-domain-containing protein [Mycena leptocephala]
MVQDQSSLTRLTGKNVAIAISSSIYEKLDGVGTVGGMVGAAVSGSFLFIVGLANSIFLWRIIRQRQRVICVYKFCVKPSDQGLPPVDEPDNLKDNIMLMMRILGPVITFINKPRKMYPVGVLFGFGFDTASSIALLAISALGRKRSDGSAIPSGYIVILPLLFTAGMTILDSADSVLMLYSIFEAPPAPADDSEQRLHADADADAQAPAHEQVARDQRAKANVMSGLSIILMLMSIFVAFRRVLPAPFSSSY